MPSRKFKESTRTPARSSTEKKPQQVVKIQPGSDDKKKRRGKHRQLRCDCGQLAITVIKLRVGTDPQYTIRMPLCRACLALEQSLQLENL